MLPLFLHKRTLHVPPTLACGELRQFMKILPDVARKRIGLTDTSGSKIYLTKSYHIAYVWTIKRFRLLFSGLCCGKAMAAYTKPQHRKRKERLRGERDQIKFIDLRFERWQVLGLRKARRRQDVP